MLGNETIMAFVPTQDYDRAKQFYVDVLGLQFVEQQQFAMVLNANGITVRVAKTPDYKPVPSTILGWKVKDLESQVKSLASKGIKFEFYDFLKQEDSGIWTSPDGAKIAWFKDPDNNVLSLAECD